MMKKKILCTVMAFAMLFASFQVAFAAGSQTEIIPDTQMNEVVIFDNEETTVVMKYKDFENGDAVLYMVEDGIITYEAYVNRATKQIIETDYQNNSSVQITNYEEVAFESQMDTQAAATYGRIGTISYSWYGFYGDKFDTTIICSNYENTDTSATFDIKGTYNNQVSLVAKIVALLGVTIAIAYPITGAIIAILGIIGDIEFTVPSMNIKCTRYSSFWKVQDTFNPAINTSYFEGSMYVVYYRDEVIRPTEGTYYPVTSFTTRNTSFALTVHNAIWGPHAVTITGWAIG